MSLASDILTEIQAVDNSSSANISNITDAIKDTAWQSACAALQGESASITDKIINSVWTVSDKEAHGINHFPTDIQALILQGKAVIPYKCTLGGNTKRVVFTRNKVYKFPTTNVNYFNAAVNSVKYYGAGSYFSSVNQTSNMNTANNTGNNYVQNYNYTQ